MTWGVTVGKRASKRRQRLEAAANTYSQSSTGAPVAVIAHIAGPPSGATSRSRSARFTFAHRTRRPLIRPPTRSGALTTNASPAGRHRHAATASGRSSFT
jgi:hypothetical protein